MNHLFGLLQRQFPDAEIPEQMLDLAIGSFPDWDSLSHISLLLSIEEHYDVRFTLDEMANLVSIRNIIQVLESHGISE
jgi:acyl carrier protein